MRIPEILGAASLLGTGRGAGELPQGLWGVQTLLTSAASQLVWGAQDSLCLNFAVSGHAVNTNPHLGQLGACCCCSCRNMQDHNYAFADFFGSDKVTETFSPSGLLQFVVGIPRS